MEREEYRRLYELEDHLWWFVGMREISLSLLERFLPARTLSRILDAGCGTGGMMEHLKTRGQAVGVDCSPQALRFARLRNLDLVQASLSHLPFLPRSFDLVTSFDVIYHRSVPDDVQALSEIARVLRPGGTLLLRVPAYEGLRSRHDEAVHTRQRYGRRELEDKLRRAGLDPLFLTYANCFLFPIAALKRIAENLLPSSSGGGSDVKPISAPLNRALRGLLRLEAKILRSASLPFGLSLIAVARR